MRKGVPRGWLVTQPKRTQPVAIPHQLRSQLLGKAHFRTDLACEGEIGSPGCLAGLVRAQEIGDPVRIPTIVLGPALAIARLSTLHHRRRQNIDLFIARLP